MDNSKRAIRSYVLRQGRMTAKQQQALTELWPLYGIDDLTHEFNFTQLFANSAINADAEDLEVVLEIGFGMGDSLATMAAANPNIHFVGIEVHRPGVGALLNAIAKAQLTNVRVICHDAVSVLQHCIPANSLTKVQLFFPDPWPKKKHHKRRLIQTEFVALLVQKLKRGAKLHLATDWQPYADHMLAVLQHNSALNNCDPDGGFWQQAVDRPLTKFEQRGHRLGHAVWDVLFAKA